MRLNKEQKGYSLIEAIVYVGILAFIVLAVYSFFLWSARANAKVKATRKTLANARMAMEIMTREIKEAKSIYTPTTSTSTQLSLETTKYLPAGEETTYIDFYLCGTRLCLKKENQSPVALTSDAVEITDLKFIKITPASIPSIQINLNVDYKDFKNRPEYHNSVNATSTASLRLY